MVKLLLLERSKRKNKKWLVVLEDSNGTQVIHFGDLRYQDYTQHKDIARRDSYRARARAIRNKKGVLTIEDPLSPNAWSYYVLWGDSTSLYRNLKNMLNLFGMGYDGVILKDLVKINLGAS